jgi:hypothetical protein
VSQPHPHDLILTNAAERAALHVSNDPAKPYREFIGWEFLIPIIAQVVIEVIKYCWNRTASDIRRSVEMDTGRAERIVYDRAYRVAHAEIARRYGLMGRLFNARAIRTQAASLARDVAPAVIKAAQESDEGEIAEVLVAASTTLSARRESTFER